MVNMMASTTGMDYGFIAIWGLHVLSVIAFFTGIIFFIIFAFKTFTADQLKNWAIALVAIGAVACLFTIAGRGGPWTEGMNGRFPYMQMNMMRDMMGGEMMDDDDMMMEMSMHDMSAMLEGLDGDDFDAAFIEGMIPHHQGAIDMANAALKSAKHAEIQKMAKDIISAQQREIDQMKQWQKNWGYLD